ncbi:hypothetical protein [Methanococcus maripaludis]|uniref:Uncharacterized protein n=1 Tax=Methanococcus maripaludis OS7 TaxID=637915 RepID=A0A2Z5PFV8_METMI|nr:hypothetical protein [Methanococcus maripaludis]BAP62130.1 hypothetical protein MMOS7_00440 [Methanococcus maripaludis OS7]
MSSEANSLAMTPSLLKNVIFGFMILAAFVGYSGDIFGTTIPYIGLVIDFIVQIGASLAYGIPGLILFFLSKRNRDADYFALIWIIIGILYAVTENTLTGIAGLITPVVSKLPTLVTGLIVLALDIYFAIQLYRED